MSFDNMESNCNCCGLPFHECKAMNELDDEFAGPCNHCDGTGMKFQGDLHDGDCILCGGLGYL